MSLSDERHILFDEDEAIDVEIQNATTPQSSNAQKMATVLFVDDEKPILRSMERFGRSRSWRVLTADSGEQALELLSENQIDVVVSDMRMQGMNGDELLMTFRDRSPETMRILLTGYSDISALENAINEAHIYNYLTKPWDESLLNEVIESALRFKYSEQERERLEDLTRAQNKKLSRLALLLDKRVKERSIEVDQAMQLLQITHSQAQDGVIDALAMINRILEWKEGHATGQSEFVTTYAIAIAKRLQLSDTDIELIQLAALLHRIGLLALPDTIRTKPFYLFTSEEHELFRQYPLWGETILNKSDRLRSVANIVRHHREYINGKGYPDGLSLHDIPLAAQIIGLVSDFYDAYSGQVSKATKGVEEAKVYINEWSGRRHDKKLVESLWETFEDLGLALGEETMECRIVTTRDLGENMVIEKDLVARNGTRLLAKGTPLTQPTISKLIDYEQKYKEVFEIYICVNKNDLTSGTT